MSDNEPISTSIRKPTHDTNCGKPYHQPAHYSPIYEPEIRKSEIQKEERTVKFEMWIYAALIVMFAVAAVVAH